MFHLFKKEYSTEVSKKLLTLVLGALVFSTTAQVFYSTNPLYLKSKSEQNNLLSTYRCNYPDTSITELSNYFPRNFMGNMGMPSPNYLLKYGTGNLGFQLLPSPLENDKFKDSQVMYYRSKGPYASLNGIAGSKEFQIFKMLFTHTYKDKVNLTVGFNRYTSKGYYLRQQTYTNNFYLSSNYTSRSKRAGYYLYLLNNGNKNQENGGIIDSVLTDSSMVLNKNLFKTNLNAKRDNREFKAMLNPWYRLNKLSDSSHATDHFVQFKSSFATNAYRYEDTARYFYDRTYLDTIKTVDSTRVRKFINELYYAFLKRNETLGFSAGYKNEINQVWQHTDSVFVNHMLQSDLVYRTKLSSKDSSTKFPKTFETHLNAQYVLAGSNAGDYKLESSSRLEFNPLKKRELFLNVLVEQRHADYMYNTWISNHFYWFNKGLGAQQQFQVKLGIQLGKYFTASVFNQNISNYLYFDKEGNSAQYKGTISNLGVNLTFTKIFFKHLGFALSHVYQSTSNTDVVRIPQNASTIKLFYSGSTAGANMQLQIGTQLQVYESFYAYNYMPSTQVFYLQDNFKTDLYPYLDVYVNVRIRPVSFFLKMENSLHGLSGPNYAFVPGYYQTDRAFRFGITWVFFD